MLVAAGSSLAADPTGTPAPEDGQVQSVEGLKEVLVTARKRQESFQSTPVIESVISQQALERFQTHDLYVLADQVPGLLLGGGVGAYGATASIRGVGTSVESPTVDQSVALDVDGMPLSQGLAYNTAMFDVGQVEVLKGPQALLYGKNNTGGVIMLRSADPTDTPEVIVRGGYEAEAQEKLGEIVLSGPVAPSLKLRLAAHYSDDNGFFSNRDVAPAGYGVLTPTTSNFDADQNAIVRGTALFEPSAFYRARLKVNYSYDFVNDGGEDETIAGCPFGLTSFTGFPVLDPSDDCKLGQIVYDPRLDPTYWPGVRNGGIPFSRSTQEFGTLEQNVHLGAFTVTAITGFYELHQQSLLNGSATTLVTLAPDNDFSNREFTQEVRLASDFTHSPVNFMLGGFYQNGHMVNSVRILGNTGIPGVPLPAVLQDNIQGVNINSISGFGQLIWNVTDAIELDAGARVTHEARTHTEDNFDIISGPLGPTPLADPYISSTDTSPEVTLTYRPSDELTFFGSFKEGFKSGSFNTVVYYDPTTRSSFGDEKVRGDEVGLKSLLFDRQLRIDLDGYSYHYVGLQVGADVITPTGGLVLTTLNAASANVRGVDLDVDFAPARIRGLTLRTSLNYNLARYDSFPDAPCSNGQLISEGCDQAYDAALGANTAQNLSGRPLVRAPDVTVTSGADYEMPVGRDMTLGLGATVTYTSEYYTALIDRNAPGFLQGGFAKANLSASFGGPDDAWAVALIGNNVANKITTSHCDNAPVLGDILFSGEVSGTNTRGPGGDDYPTCLPERGREIWLRVTLRPLQLFGRQ